ncbi:MAG: hypothetical protein ABEH81_04350 [Halopenitus sp.]
MPYFECEECGRLANLQRFERSQLREHCPGCEETRTWNAAFEADEGVSF